MGLIKEGDEDLHHSDNSHRLVAPFGANEAAWQRRMAAHRERHRSGEPERARRSPRDRTDAPITGGVPEPPRS